MYTFRQLLLISAKDAIFAGLLLLNPLLPPGMTICEMFAQDNGFKLLPRSWWFRRKQTLAIFERFGVLCRDAISVEKLQREAPPAVVAGRAKADGLLTFRTRCADMAK